MGERFGMRSGWPMDSKAKCILVPYTLQQKKEGKLLLRFTSTGNGLMIKGINWKDFAIAGADKKSVPADAVIRGDGYRYPATL